MAIRSQAYSGIKEPVRYTTTGNITLSGLGTQANGDWAGALTAGDRILVKDQSTPAENGIYEAAIGSWSRARDANKAGELDSGTLVPVSEGSTLASSLWNLVAAVPGAINIGVSSFSFDAAQSAIFIPLTAIDQPNGVAGLDGSGKVSPSAIPPGGLNYKGTWDANTNTPALADGTGTSGDLYVVSVAGTQDLGSGSILFSVGDFVIYNDGLSGVWEKISTGGGGVSTVNGQSGVVVLNLDDINDVNTLLGLGNFLELAAGTWRRSDLSALGGSNSLSIQLSSSVGSSSFAVDPTELEVVAEDVTDNTYGNAPELKLTAKYDSDTGAGLTNTHYPFSVGGEMSSGGVSPAGNMKFSVNGTTHMRLTSAGQLQLPTNGGTSAGVVLGGDAQIYRSAANIISVGSGDKIQQNTAPSTGDDIVNKTYADSLMPAGTILDYAGSAVVDSPTGFLPCNGDPYPTGTYPALFAAIAYTYGAGPTGASHFRVPNFNGRVSMGAGSGVGEGTSGTGTISGSTGLTVRTRGDWGGNERHQLSPAESGQKPLTSTAGTEVSATVVTWTGGTGSTQAVSLTMNPHDHGPGNGTYYITRNDFSGSLGFAGGSYSINIGATTTADRTSTGSGSFLKSGLTTAQNAHTHTISGATASTGHNNVQPYLVINKIIKY